MMWLCFIMSSKWYNNVWDIKVMVEETVEVPANSMRPQSISASMQPAAHMSMALV